MSKPAKTMVKKVSAPKKSTGTPGAVRRSPILSLSKGGKDMAERRGTTEEERKGMIECNNKVEDQRQGRKYLVGTLN